MTLTTQKLGASIDRLLEADWFDQATAEVSRGCPKGCSHAGVRVTLEVDYEGDLEVQVESADGARARCWLEWRGDVLQVCGGLPGCPTMEELLERLLERN